MYCVVQEGKEDDWHLLALVLSINECHPGSRCKIWGSESLRDLVCGLPFPLRIGVEWSTRPSEEIGDIGSHMEMLRKAWTSQAHSGLASVFLSGRSILLRPVSVPKEVVEQGIGYIKKDVEMAEEHAHQLYSLDVLYVSDPSLVSSLLSEDADDKLDDYWKAGLRMSERLDHYLDGGLFCATECFFALQNEWKLGEIDFPSMARKDRELEVLFLRDTGVESPRVRELTTALATALPQFKPSFVAILNLKYCAAKLDISAPPLDGLAFWDRSGDMPGVRNLLSRIGEQSPYFTFKERVDGDYFVVSNHVVYDYASAERITNALRRTFGVISAFPTSEVSSALAKLPAKCKRLDLPFFLQEPAVVERIKTEASSEAPRLGVVDLPDFTAYTGDDYEQLLISLSKAEYFRCYPAGKYVGEALALGCVPHASTLHPHLLDLKDFRCSWAQASEACMNHFDTYCTDKAIAALLARHILVGHIEGYDLQCDGEVPIVGVHNPSHVIQ